MTEGVTLTVQRPWSLAALILGAGTIVFAVVVFVLFAGTGLMLGARAARP